MEVNRASKKQRVAVMGRVVWVSHPNRGHYSNAFKHFLATHTESMKKNDRKWQKRSQSTNLSAPGWQLVNSSGNISTSLLVHPRPRPQQITTDNPLPESQSWNISKMPWRMTPHRSSWFSLGVIRWFHAWPRHLQILQVWSCHYYLGRVIEFDKTEPVWNVKSHEMAWL